MVVYIRIWKTLTFAFACILCEGAELLKEAMLHEVLFENYNPRVRPVSDSTTALNVEVAMYLLRITDLSEKNQVLTSSIWMDIRWYDELLQWNESDYGGVSSILADKNKIWTPDLLVQNEIGNKRGIGETTLNDPIVMSDGHVTWWPGKEIKTTCKVDSTKYPFDSQFCEIEISKWYSNDNVLNITYTYPSVDLVHYEQSEEWEILSAIVRKHRHFEANQNFSRIKYGMTLQRRPLFYVLNIMVPLIILSLLNQLCFILPIESGEKIGMCMSIFLTFVVFLTLISDTLPQSSIHIPIFGMYLVFQLVISGLIIGLEVLVLYTYHTPQKEVKDRNTRVCHCDNDRISQVNSDDQTINNKIVRINTLTHNEFSLKTPEPELNGSHKAAKLNRILGYMVLGVNTFTLVLLFVVLHS
ncbi:acetylcholine receptor subunit alpha-L1-like [Pecten maximus]|uniref:acetylcholine receptor subunit alpha-L1-like n=1 Tax=Pecten maximus TaxID=6579 RepID=UPI001458455C|nr:acetylcholine receptor subunit alpha-L1-like [Pecten maximus]